MSSVITSSYESELNHLISQVQSLYVEDQIPWVLGYSGGKDSTATLQLVWMAIERLPESKRHKTVHVISTDTLVENPVVSQWVGVSLSRINEAAKSQNLPFISHKLTPDPSDSFWVNLIGKGYPAPRPKFRWCTSRLKINPANKFVTDMVQAAGEVIMVLGTRKAESSARHAVMKKYEEQSTRDLLSANGQLDRSWVYAPISEWSNDEVWQFLMKEKNPWGNRNKDLLGMYQGATEDGECPLVVDTSTQSCGDSRFGCYVCTLVSKDKSMEAMIKNDDEKEWMRPLLEFRNKYLDATDPETGKFNDRHRRDFRRMNGSLMVHNDELVHGPYIQSYRETLLEQLLKAQSEMRKAANKGDAPDYVKEYEAITIDELVEIRRIWITEKHEIEDSLPSIYLTATGQEWPRSNFEYSQALSANDLQTLKSICEETGDDEGIHYQVVRELINIEHSYRTMSRRSGLYKALDDALKKGAFDSKAEAKRFALKRREGIQNEQDKARKEIEIQLGTNVGVKS